MLELKEPTVVRNLVSQKQQLEVRLAWELLEVFNDPEAGLIGMLRKMVKRSLDEMVRIASDRRFSARFHEEWCGWRKYACCTGHGIHDWWPAVIEIRIRHFDAQDCADWIRIFGEVLEKVTRGDRDMIRRSYQNGDGYYWNKYAAGHPGNRFEGLGLPQQDAGRRRLKDEHIEEAQRRGQPVSGMGSYAERQTPVWGFQCSVSPKAGLNSWRVMADDLTGKMDQVFGLTPGATISGTTTDNIFFLERFCTVGLNPVFYLLPLATIVSQGHHTLLECALPLTLLGINHYKVGLYTSLFPTDMGPSRSPGAARIKSALTLADHHNQNRLMLLYFRGGAPGPPVGCFDFDRSEWQGIATGEALMGQFKALGPWPNRARTERLRAALGITVHRTYGAEVHA